MQETTSFSRRLRKRPLVFALVGLVIACGVTTCQLLVSPADRLHHRLTRNLLGLEALSVNPRPGVRWMDYKMQRGENVWDLSRKTGLRIDTILSVNELDKPHTLVAGRILRFPHLDGLLVSFGTNESLTNLSGTREIPLEALRYYNGLAPGQEPRPGSKVFLPGARMSADERASLIGSELNNPMSPGTYRFTGGYGWRIHPITRAREFHRGVDLGSGIGTTVYAAQSGTVLWATFDYGYGMFIAIQHKKGYVSRYAHLSRMYVKAGQTVGVGTPIGAVGMTGRTTGPHLHFEVMRDGIFIDPREVTALR